MKDRLLLALVLLFSIMSAFAQAQPGYGIGPEHVAAPKKDQSAVALLKHALRVTGWDMTLPSDAVLTAEFTRSRDGVSQATVPVTYKLKGPDKHITVLPQGASIVNGSRSRHQLASGTHNGYGSAVRSMRPPVLPLYSEISTAPAGDFDIYQQRESIIGDELCDVVVLEPNVQPREAESVKSERRARRVTIWISRTTGLPRQFEFARRMETNPSAILEYTVLVGDYRNASGRLVPFYQAEFIRNQPRHEIRISSVQFDVGLSDADFEISEAGGTR